MDISSIIRAESLNESYRFNNIKDNDSADKLYDLIESLEYSYFKVPLTEDTVHVICHEGNYIIPYDDMKKYCQFNKVGSFVEAVPIIAKHYGIKPDKVYIGIYEDSSINDLDTTTSRIEDAIDSNVSINNYHCWDDDDDFDDECITMMYGSDAKLVDDSELKNINDPLCNLDTNKSKLLQGVDFVKVFPANCIKYEASMVNLYNVGLDYYMEMDELERYMNYSGINSVKEAVMNIAEANNLEDDYNHIVILAEDSYIIKNKRCKSNSYRNTNARLEAMNMIINNNLNKLNLAWISKY